VVLRVPGIGSLGLQFKSSFGLAKFVAETILCQVLLRRIIVTIYRFSMWVPFDGKYENYWAKPPTVEQVIQRLREENPEDGERCKRFVDQRIKLLNDGKGEIVAEEVKENN
jgi:hypothetical protein